MGVFGFVKNLAVESATRFFTDWFIVSQISFADSEDGLCETALPWAWLKVEHADGAKCPRCWQWDEAVVESEEPEKLLCRRCKDILGK